MKNIIALDGMESRSSDGEEISTADTKVAHSNVVGLKKKLIPFELVRLLDYNDD